MRGRQGLNNIVAIDARSRSRDASAYQANLTKIGHHPMLILFDILAAFPSLSHDFLFLFLGRCEIPQGLMYYLVALYSNNAAVGTCNGIVIVLYLIESGILQGCPLSGSLFALALDTFIRMYNAELPGQMMKAFADDMATVLDRLGLLPRVYRCYSLLEKATGLAVKPTKSVFILLGVNTNDATDEVQRAQNFVRKFVPEWSGVKFAWVGKYLGFNIGQRGGTCSSWDAPVAKFKARVEIVASNPHAPSLLMVYYNRSVCTTLSYVEELCPPPPDLAKMETTAITRILKLPAWALATDGAVKLKDCGLTAPPSLVVRGLAARERTAMKTCSAWPDALSELLEVRRAHGPMTNLAAVSAEMKDWKWWETEAFADVLGRAFANRSHLPRVPQITKQVQRRARSASQKTHEPPNESHNGRKKSLQARIYEVKFAERFPASLADWLAKKIRHFVQAETLDNDTLLARIGAVVGVAHQCCPSVAWAWVKAICNGWLTTSRFGATKLCCQFGCGRLHPDSLSHYIICPILDKLVEMVCRGRVHWVHAGGLLEFFGLDGCNLVSSYLKECLGLLAIKTDVYNCVRNHRLFAYDYYSPLDRLEYDANLESEIDDSLANVANLLDDERGVHLFHTTRDSLLRLLRASKFSMFKVVTPRISGSWGVCVDLTNLATPVLVSPPTPVSAGVADGEITPVLPARETSKRGVHPRLRDLPHV